MMWMMWQCCDNSWPLTPDHSNLMRLADHQPLTTATLMRLADHQPLTPARWFSWEWLLWLLRIAECWEELLRMAENDCAEKSCWELLRMIVLTRAAENGCGSRLLKNFFFFLRRVGLVDTGGRQPSRHFLVVGRPILWWNANFTHVPRNPLVTSCSSDAQNCGEMRILHMSLSSLRARRTSKTVAKCKILWVVARPYRCFVLIGHPKLWWNANFYFDRATLSSLRAGQTSETVVKWWFCMPLDSYILAHAAVAKRAFWNFGWHAVVVRRTFWFCWMNPLVRFGGSIARNCSEMQILSSRNCSAHWPRVVTDCVLEALFCGLARNDRFGNFLCQNCRKPRAKP